MITLKKLKTTFYLFKLQYIKDLAPPFPKVDLAPPFPKVDLAPPFPKVDLAPPFPKVDLAPPFPKVEKVLSHNKIPA